MHTSAAGSRGENTISARRDLSLRTPRRRGGGTNQVRKGIQNETDVSSNEMKDQVPLLTQSRRMFSGVAVVRIHQVI